MPQKNIQRGQKKKVCQGCATGSYKSNCYQCIQKKTDGIMKISNWRSEVVAIKKKTPETTGKSSLVRKNKVRLARGPPTFDSIGFASRSHTKK